MDKQVYKASLSLDKMPPWVLAVNYRASKTWDGDAVAG